MKVYASILGADLLHLGVFIDKLTMMGVDGIHLDFMDHHYVPNMAFGPAWIEQIRRYTDLPIHVHLMMKQVDAKKCYDWHQLGASAFMIHPETWVDSHDAWVQMCQDMPTYAVINPMPDRINLSSIASYVRGVLMMTVRPGFAGQTFIAEALQGIPAGFDEVWVDGGVGRDQLPDLCDRGIMGVVLGSSLNSDDAADLIAAYKSAN